ncbi:protein sidekick-1-like [Sesbania bispinosa]|nr:protein sidekick-1-like [Sesbania bispinosa]KAJ1405615.1 protein sidekick-1-like [Sesbania bispinosa]
MTPTRVKYVDVMMGEVYRRWLQRLVMGGRVTTRLGMGGVCTQFCPEAICSSF